jgi:hypothetical protein
MGLLHADLAQGVGDLFDHVQNLKQVHVSGLGVELGLDLPLLEDPRGSGQDGLLDGLGENRLRDVLLPADLLEDREKFFSRQTCSRTVRRFTASSIGYLPSTRLARRI